MKTVSYTPSMSFDGTPRVVALGFFDGFHRGHRALLEKARALSLSEGAELSVFTFSSEGRIKREVPRLYSTDQRLFLFEKFGVETVFVADFEALADSSAEGFVKDILIGALGAKIAVAGYNFRFSKGALAGAEELCRLMLDGGGHAEILPPYLHNGEPISATQIRTLLSEGRVKEATLLLGAPYFFSGKVEHGAGRGHGLGFPTVNLPYTEKSLLVKRGVYASATELDGALYPSVTNVGTCPTIQDRPIHSETHLIGQRVDAYGKSVRVYLLDYLREEQRFPSEKALTMQINVDKNTAIQKYEENKNTIKSLLGL